MPVPVLIGKGRLYFRMVGIEWQNQQGQWCQTKKWFLFSVVQLQQDGLIMGSTQLMLEKLSIAQYALAGMETHACMKHKFRYSIARITFCITYQVQHIATRDIVRPHLVSSIDLDLCLFSTSLTYIPNVVSSRLCPWLCTNWKWIL